MVVPLLLAGLALVHPTWAGGSVAPAAAGGWWIPVHGLLLLGFGALGWLWWLGHWTSRFAVGAFLLCNAAFLAIDGIAVGLMAANDPVGADVLWNSPWVELLSDATGATWAAGCSPPRGRSNLERAIDRATLGGLALTWLTFVASGYVPYAGAASRVVALATGSYAIYRPARSWSLSHCSSSPRFCANTSAPRPPSACSVSRWHLPAARRTRATTG